MGKPDALTCRSSIEKLGAEERMFKENQLLALDGINAEEVSDIQLDGINCSSWQRSPNSLLLVPEEYRLEILCQCHNSKIAGHWGRQ